MTTFPPRNPYRRNVEILFQIRTEDPERLFGTERLFLQLLVIVITCLPTTLVRLVGGWLGYRGRKIAVDLWVIAKPATLFGLLLLGLFTRRWAAIIALICLLDLYAYLLGLIFLKRYYTPPASYGRSVLALAINFVEAAFAFALLYLYTGVLAGRSGLVQSWGEAVYFSVITSATVGYGDIVPRNPIGRGLVVAQVLSSLLFIAIVLSTFVSNFAGGSPDRWAAKSGEDKDCSNQK
jgi:NADH:ubiquinone oxidoreductase subunit K